MHRTCKATKTFELFPELVSRQPSFIDLAHTMWQSELGQVLGKHVEPYFKQNQHLHNLGYVYLAYTTTD